jgi:hypothetical protein
VAFSPNNAILASASCRAFDKEDGLECIQGEIILWNVSITAWKARACRAAGRNLTWEEWQRYLPGRPYEQTCPDLPPHPSAVEAGAIE